MEIQLERLQTAAAYYWNHLADRTAVRSMVGY